MVKQHNLRRRKESYNIEIIYSYIITITFKHLRTFRFYYIRLRL